MTAPRGGKKSKQVPSVTKLEAEIAFNEEGQMVEQVSLFNDAAAPEIDSAYADEQIGRYLAACENWVVERIRASKEEYRDLILERQVEWGDKTSEGLQNLGLVIGTKLVRPGKDDALCVLRVDWDGKDPNKALHINIDFGPALNHAKYFSKVALSFTQLSVRYDKANIYSPVNDENVPYEPSAFAIHCENTNPTLGAAIKDYYFINSTIAALRQNEKLPLKIAEKIEKNFPSMAPYQYKLADIRDGQDNDLYVIALNSKSMSLRGI